MDLLFFSVKVMTHSKVIQMSLFVPKTKPNESFSSPTLTHQQVKAFVKLPLTLVKILKSNNTFH